MRRACCALAVVAALMALCAPGPVAAAPMPSGTPSSVAVPPAAPAPTDSGNSPRAPDPHPPLGGLGPDGAAVGGARLRSRGVVKPAATKPLPGSLTAQSWILVDLDTGDVLAARDPHGRYQPASILKILTAVTLLPLLAGKRVVTVGKSASLAEGSRAGLVWRGRYTVDQLFAGMLLVSGNDTAAALADAVGGYRHTVDLMNATAHRLGAYDTFVQTPSGLDGWQQLTSTYDMALVLRAALGMPRFVKYDRQPTGTLPWQKVNGVGPVTLHNQSLTFLTTVRGALVAKTGYTDAAQHTFIGAVERDGRRLGVVFLRAQRWPTDQWQQATDLMEWGFALPKGTAPVGRLSSRATTSVVSSRALDSRGAPVVAARHSSSPVRSRQLVLYTGIGLLGLGLVAGFALWRVRRAR